MKKFFSLMLCSIMIFGLTACGSSGNHDEWDDKSVRVPTVELTMQEVTYHPVEGVDIKDVLMVSPLTYDKYQPDKILEQLQNLDCVNEWSCTTSTSEVAYPYFTENGQLTAYKYGETVTLHEMKAERKTNQSVSVSYNNDTDDIIGYSDISVSFQYSVGGDNLSQSQMHDILQAVYGKEYADFLCYAEMDEDDGYAEYKIQEGDAVIVFSRSTENHGIDFRVACKNKAKEATNGYAGNYTPKLQQLSVLPDLMNWGADECDVQNVSAMGKSFLEKHFGTTASFTMGTSQNEQLAGGYTYGVEDGTTSVHMQYRIAQPDVKESQRLKTQMTYKISEQKTESYVSLELGTIKKEDLTDESRNAMITKALNIVADILQTDDVLNAFDSDKYFAITVDGAETYIRFALHFNPDENGNEKVSMQFGTSTDINDLNVK